MPPEQPSFRADIEGLRGVAILLVVLFHAGVPALAGGFVGVDVFFVLSGFFITGLLVRERETSGEVDLLGVLRATCAAAAARAPARAARHPARGDDALRADRSR
jgi:peptidoglycan/LPS O-acetylase OafA/YrhL